MRIRRDKSGSENPALPMTSMIDIVFPLLVFFVMTFKIAALEGDFSIHMAAGDGPAATNLPLKLRMKADVDGNLLSMVSTDALPDRAAVPDDSIAG